MTQNPTRELQLDFSIDDVKNSIARIVEVSVGSYQLLDRNDVFNTFRIASVSGLLSGIISITLKRIDENSTEWKSEIMSAAGAKVSPAVLARYQDEFLTILSKALSGEEINQQLVKGNKSGCLGFLLFMLTTASIIFYLTS